MATEKITAAFVSVLITILFTIIAIAGTGWITVPDNGSGCTTKYGILQGCVSCTGSYYGGAQSNCNYYAGGSFLWFGGGGSGGSSSLPTTTIQSGGGWAFAFLFLGFWAGIVSAVVLFRLFRGMAAMKFMKNVHQLKIAYFALLTHTVLLTAAWFFYVCIAYADPVYTSMRVTQNAHPDYAFCLCFIASLISIGMTIMMYFVVKNENWKIPTLNTNYPGANNSGFGGRPSDGMDTTVYSKLPYPPQPVFPGHSRPSGGLPAYNDLPPAPLPSAPIDASAPPAALSSSPLLQSAAPSAPLLTPTAPPAMIFAEPAPLRDVSVSGHENAAARDPGVVPVIPPPQGARQSAVLPDTVYAATLPPPGAEVALLNPVAMSPDATQYAAMGFNIIGAPAPGAPVQVYSNQPQPMQPMPPAPGGPVVYNIPPGGGQPIVVPQGGGMPLIIPAPNYQGPPPAGAGLPAYVDPYAQQPAGLPAYNPAGAPPAPGLPAYQQPAPTPDSPYAPMPAPFVVPEVAPVHPGLPSYVHPSQPAGLPAYVEPQRPVSGPPAGLPAYVDPSTAGGAGLPAYAEPAPARTAAALPAYVEPQAAAPPAGLPAYVDPSQPAGQPAGLPAYVPPAGLPAYRDPGQNA